MMLPPKLAATLRFALAAGDTKEVAFESVDIGGAGDSLCRMGVEGRQCLQKIQGTSQWRNPIASSRAIICRSWSSCAECRLEHRAVMVYSRSVLYSSRKAHRRCCRLGCRFADGRRTFLTQQSLYKKCDWCPEHNYRKHRNGPLPHYISGIEFKKSTVIDREPPTYLATTTLASTSPRKDYSLEQSPSHLPTHSQPPLQALPVADQLHKL